MNELAASTDRAICDLGLLSELGWLARQEEDFRDYLAANCHRRTFMPGDSIAFEDDTDPMIYGVITGSVACLRSHRHEVPILATLLFPGQWFGSGPTLAKAARVLSFVAKEQTSLVCLDLAVLALMRARFPDLGNRLAQMAQMQANHAVDIVAELLIPETELRIAAVLIRLMNLTVPGTSFPLSQTELAEMANASRASSGKVVRELKQSGILMIHYGRITVANRRGLTDWFEDRLARD